MPYPVDILRNSIKDLIASVPQVGAFTFTWKKSFASIRDGETVPRIDAVIKRRWKEPFTAEDNAAWLGFYEVDLAMLFDNASRALQINAPTDYAYESMRHEVTVKLIDIPTVQSFITVYSPNLILDDIDLRPSKDFSGGLLLREVTYIPITLLYKLQESRTGVY